MLTQHQIETFKEKGLIRLDKFLPIEKVCAAQDFIFRLAEKEGAWQDGAWQLGPTSDRPEFTKPISKSAFNILTTPELQAVINLLVSGQPLKTIGNPSLLFTLPQAPPWAMLNSWHLDVPRQSHGGLPGVQMFTFLNMVIPRGGGTLVVTGSHRLVSNRKFIRSKDVKKRLQEYPYFQALTSNDLRNPEHFLTTPGKVSGVELQVVELYGEPGDVFLTDMRILHTGSRNIADIPRLMVTQRYYLESTIT